MKRRLKNRILSGLAVLLILSSFLLPALNVRAEGDSLPEAEVVEEVLENAVEESSEEAPEEVREDGFCVQSIEVHPDGEESDKRVVLEGLMPENVTAEAVDVTEERDSNVIAAYDITLTDGEDEFQPEKGNPISVEISDERISADNENLQLWHILDDGTRVRVLDFTVEDGKISFAATGFSVYEIVDAPAPFTPDPQDISDLSGFTGTDSDKGFYFYYLSDGKKNYFTNSDNGSGCLTEKASVLDASIWYTQKVETNESYYKCYFYTFVSGAKKYLYNVGTSNNVGLTDNPDEATVIIITSNGNGSFLMKHDTQNKWLQHSNSGKGIRFFTDHNSSANSSIHATLASSVNPADDVYGFDGKSFGLMNYQNGTSGNALMAEANSNGNALKATALIVRKNTVDKDNILFVAANSNITIWTFHSTKEDYYTLSTSVGGTTKYLKMIATALSLTENESEATAFKVTPKDGKIKLAADGKAVTLSGSTFKQDNDKAYNTQYQNLVELSSLTEDDFVVYSAYKVGISDKDETTGEYLVPNQAQVIVYTRIWDDTNKVYNFYAVDHDGSLIPCYERGDNIMWVGSKINTLLWDFTEYYNSDGTPNYYYELQNNYSGKYLAPQIKDHQVLADNKIGINLPGRRDDQYYTTILAWDDPYYSYAGIKTDFTNGIITSCPKKEAETFYVAIMEPVVDHLTEVETVDNELYGIRMRMKDFKDRVDMSKFFGTDTGGTDPKVDAGILSTDLGDDGYPKTAYDSTTPGYVKDKSLAEFFDGAEGVNHLFLESTYGATGYFEFDSTQAFATLTDQKDAKGNRLFRVYEQLGTVNNPPRPSLKHGQFLPYNDIKAGYYAQGDAFNNYDALLNPLSEEDPRKGEKLYRVDDPNYQNAMEITAGFVQTPNGLDAWGHDIIFEFTGDDDFWLYVDGELVIDLGGIHPALAGKVNFANGKVVVNGVNTTLKEIFYNNYLGRNHTAAEAQEYVDGIFKEKKVGEETYYVFNDYSEHEMKVYYMERGGGASNLHMRFNLSYITPGSVMLSKEITGLENLDDDMDFSLVEFPYQIWYKMPDDETEYPLTNDNQHIRVVYQNSTQKVEFREHYTPPNATVAFDNVYFINPDMVAEIRFIENTYSYRIVECGINTEVYNQVTVEGIDDTKITVSDVPGNDARKSYAIPWAKVEDRKTVVYRNHVNPLGIRTLSIHKELHDEKGQLLYADQDKTTFSFRLYLTNGADDWDKLALANMVKYRVRDRYDNLCKWDVDSGTFVSIGKEKYKELTQKEKNLVTFETSINGQISRIPAGFTVEVPGLPVGTIFKVVERENEIPLGYMLKGYERDKDSYEIVDVNSVNAGRVRLIDSPSLTVKNQRCWEIQVEKEWSDRDYVTLHDSIYTAVYVNDTFLNGTVRQIKDPGTTVRYTFESLDPGSEFADYKVYEVKLNNPTFDTEGNLVDYESIAEKIEDGHPTTIGAIAEGNSVMLNYSYSVTYESKAAEKTAEGAPEGGNIREDKIINTRSGGIVISLYEMGSDPKVALAGGTFSLQRIDKATNTTVDEGTFKSDSKGRITILYDFKMADEAEYILTQIASPGGYIGLDNPIIFTITDAKEIAFGDQNSGEWRDWNKPAIDTDKLIAYINVYNKSYSIEVYKYDGATNGVSGLKEAHFELHRAVNGGQGGKVKDYVPMAGYEDLVTGADGIIAGINHELAPNTYYLTEKTPPAGYKGLDEDVIFEISPLGEWTLISSPVGSGVEIVPTPVGNTIKYRLNIPNTKENEAILTVSKTVEGGYGNKAEDFSFVFKTNDADTTEYDYAVRDENGTVTGGYKISNGKTFTLSHGESVLISLPEGTEVTIEEFDYSVTGYLTTVAVDNAAAVETRSVTGVISTDTVYAFTNSKEALVPTGVWMPLGGMITLAVILLAGGMILIANKRRYLREL